MLSNYYVFLAQSADDPYRLDEMSYEDLLDLSAEIQVIMSEKDRKYQVYIEDISYGESTYEKKNRYPESKL